MADSDPMVGVQVRGEGVWAPGPQPARRCGATGSGRRNRRAVWQAAQYVLSPCWNDSVARWWRPPPTRGAGIAAAQFGPVDPACKAAPGNAILGRKQWRR